MRKIVASLLAIAITFGNFVSFPNGESQAAAAYADTQTPASAPASGRNLSTTSLAQYPHLSFKQGKTLTMKTGGSRQLKLVGAVGSIAWKSSNGRIANVTQKGVLSAKRPGAAVITARDQQTGQAAVCTVKTYRLRTQKQARKALLAFKKTYRPGQTWTNDNYYFWQARQCHCYGCVAFAGIASDHVFGKYAPFKRHSSFEGIKAGDHVRIGGNHSVVVLHKKSRSIIVAEGNYNATIRWGRVITKASLERSGFYVETRY